MFLWEPEQTIAIGTTMTPSLTRLRLNAYQAHSVE